MLELKDVQYQPSTSETSILNGVNLTIHLGIPVLIAGDSGSGKTSLVEVISGLSSPNSGIFNWNGQPMMERQRRLLCGVVFQFPERHFLGLSILNELKLGQKRLSTENQLKVLRQVGLSKVDTRQAPERLSGGQQRRLAIAVQLIRKPNLLILDEPTAGLDWYSKDEILSILENLAKQQLLLIVTHEPKIFNKLNTCSYRLEKGKLV
tara:strand:- start:1965 stop:2585 length:621 start_codon:yes stop_codon:yes gene_type:complete